MLVLKSIVMQNIELKHVWEIYTKAKVWDTAVISTVICSGQQYGYTYGYEGMV